MDPNRPDIPTIPDTMDALSQKAPHYDLSNIGHKVREQLYQVEPESVEAPIVVVPNTFPPTPSGLLRYGTKTGEVDPDDPYVQGALTSPPYTGISYEVDIHISERGGLRVESTKGPFLSMPEIETYYPPIILEALTQLYEEYNEAFISLVDANGEWDTDYQYVLDENRNPTNLMVQIDMSALPPSFLEEAQSLPIDDVREILRGLIYEFENSLAMYQLLGRLFPGENYSPSLFDTQFRESLSDIRETTGKKVAVVAVTEGKYEAIKQEEFGKLPEEELPDSEVERLTGFDRVFSPQELQEYYNQCLERGEDGEYLFVVRSSDPVSKLKDPGSVTPPSLLDDPNMRRFIKMYSLTLNIDGPDTLPENMINDTKGYMEVMGMGLEIPDVRGFNRIYSKGFLREVVLQQLKSFLPKPTYYNTTLKQTVYDRTLRPFGKINSGQSEDPNLTQDSLIADIDRATYLSILENFPLTEVFSQEGIEELKRLGILSEEELNTPTKSVADIFGLQLLTHKDNKLQQKSLKTIQKILEGVSPGHLIAPELAEHLALRGIDVQELENEPRGVRLKPMLHSYGAYGHHTLRLPDIRGLRKILAEIQRRGPYILQPELDNPIFIINGVPMAVIDRNFFSIVNGKVRFMGGFRSAMPLDTWEGAKNNVHGNNKTHWLPIYPKQYD